jgi:hypothetical protein
MGLLGARQIYGVTTDFQSPFAGERGGILTLGSFSGVIMAAYHVNPSGKFAVGILLNDIETMDLSKEYDPGGNGRGNREVVQPQDLIQILNEGEIITDFVHHDGVALIRPGVAAYAGPSGTITALPDCGGSCIGYFLSSVGSQYFGLPAHQAGRVIYMGGGLTYEYMAPNGITHGFFNPVNIFIPTPGWVKVRIQIK